ncbi:type IIS restriction enzyme R protein, partial [Helicobacter pylori]
FFTRGRLPFKRER